MHSQQHFIDWVARRNKYKHRGIPLSVAVRDVRDIPHREQWSRTDYFVRAVHSVSNIFNHHGSRRSVCCFQRSRLPARLRRCTHDDWHHLFRQLHRVQWNQHHSDAVDARPSHRVHRHTARVLVSLRTQSLSHLGFPPHRIHIKAADDDPNRHRANFNSLHKHTFPAVRAATKWQHVSTFMCFKCFNSCAGA